MKTLKGLNILAALALTAAFVGSAWAQDNTLQQNVNVKVLAPVATVCDICGGPGGCGPGNMRSTNGYTTLNSITNNDATVTGVMNYCGDGIGGAYVCNAPWQTVTSAPNGGPIAFTRVATVGYYYYTGTCTNTGGTIQSASVFRNTFHCFPAGTLILMCDGSYEKIEDVKSGQCVESYDTDKQQFVKTTVTATTQDQTDKYYVINTSAGSLKVTPAHQIFVNGKWTDSNDIKPGDTLIGEDGKPVTVTSVQTIMASIPVYDLITDDPHDFFADHILVHNVNPGATNKDHGIGAGTLIALADGSLVPVEQIKAGDKVMSYNWSKKAFGFSVVRSAEKQTVSQYRVINGKLKVGMKQPLFIAKKTNTPKSK